ncbi:DNA polymerase epsilon, catalytic subunit a, putative [Babesia caballi]|uniref:DNA polymerase epsilon catalytic subunit n=1 Tax=Babesia caballi TaxID=5871 RepID=A0AAV4LN39_BABCB|nr:DNA polymerase epsilon, catalytic subunit a, putative [Babesia caballi]
MSYICIQVEEEYVAQIQLAPNCYIRYRNYVEVDPANCTESLKPLEYMPCAVEMFIRHFFKSVALIPLWKTLGDFYGNDTNDASTIVQSEPPALLKCDNLELCKLLEKHVVHYWLQPGTMFSSTLNLLENSDKFMSKFDGQKSLSRLNFPDMPGSLVHGSTNWRLEAVKVVAHTMRIDRAIDWKELAKIAAYEEKRHQLFMLAGESEYAALEWRPPMHRLELPSVCCGECFMVFNLDVLSNFASERDDTGITSYFWHCELCGARLRNRDVELRMIRFLDQLFCAYQAQDLVCRQCRTVKLLPLSRVCTCGGEFAARLPRERWRDSCKVLSQLSDLAGMKCLRETSAVFRDMWKDL